MTCPNGALDASCFGLAVCPDFSTCDLDANSLDVINTGTGQGVSVTKTAFTITSPSPYGYAITLGDSGVLNNKVGPMKVYANTLTLDGAVTTLLRTLSGTLTLQTGLSSITNHIILNTLAGQVQISSASHVIISSASGVIQATAGSSSIVMQNSGLSTLSATTFIGNAANFTLYDSISASQWFKSDPTQSYECPMVGTTLTSTLLRTSVGFGTDIVMAVGTRLLSRNTDGLVEMTGINLYCNHLIKTTDASPLQLQEDTNSTVDIRGAIVNNDLAVPAVRFTDIDGVDFQGTPIRDSFGGGLFVDDAIGLRLRDNTTLSTSIIAPVFPTTMVTIIGDLNVTGSIYADGSILSAGSCCVSDLRAKENIVDVAPSDDLATVLSFPRRVSFRYKDEYQRVDRSVKNETYNGFIAQELEDRFPTIVNHQNKMRLASGEVLEDFRTLTLQNMVPYLVGAIKALNDEIHHLKRELKTLRESDKR